MKVTVDPGSAESLVSAARYFAGGDLALVYIYTDIIGSRAYYRDLTAEIDSEDLRPSRYVPFPGSWWLRDDGKHGWQDYYLSKDGNRVLTCHYRMERLVFEDVDADFDVNVWQRKMEYERSYIERLRAEGNERLLQVHDPDVGVRNDGVRVNVRWYQAEFDQSWSKPILKIENPTLEDAMRLVSWRERPEYQRLRGT